MPNYELTDEGLVTSDPVIAAMFLGKNISEDSGLLSITDDDDTPFVVRYTNGDEAPYWDILIPYPLVRESYQPVEGEGYVVDSPALPLEQTLGVWWTNEPAAVMRRHPDIKCYHKNVLNIVTTRAELRELVSKCEESQG